MPIAIRKKKSKLKLNPISKAEISQRLIDLDLAQTSALRDLEMDVSGEMGIDSKSVIAKARKLVR